MVSLKWSAIFLVLMSMSATNPNKNKTNDKLTMVVTEDDRIRNRLELEFGSDTDLYYG